MRLQDSRLGSVLASVLLSFAGSVHVHAQPLALIGITNAPGSVTLHWQGGSGPYLVQTSPDLVGWSDQSEPGAGSSRTLAAGQQGAFYRVRDLGAETPLGAFHGLVQTEQGEFGQLLGRHRLKSRWWLHQPPGALSNVPATFFRQLIVHYQCLENGRVTTFVGPLDSLGTVATPGNAATMTVTWTRDTGPARRQFTLTLGFPYSVNTPRATLPKASDPEYELECVYATPQPELDFALALTHTTTDTIGLVQLAPPDTFDPVRAFTVSHRGASVTLAFREGNYLWQGEPQFILKTFLHHEWTAPTTAGGTTLPAFSTDSYFSRTLFPGHHNFVETVLIEPAADPALAQVTRAALATANIRYVYTFKDLAIGMSPDDIRFVGFDDSIRSP